MGCPWCQGCLLSAARYFNNGPGYLCCCRMPTAVKPSSAVVYVIWLLREISWIIKKTYPRCRERDIESYIPKNVAKQEIQILKGVK